MRLPAYGAADPSRMRYFHNMETSVKAGLSGHAGCRIKSLTHSKRCNMLTLKLIRCRRGIGVIDTTTLSCHRYDVKYDRDADQKVIFVWEKPDSEFSIAYTIGYERTPNAYQNCYVENFAGKTIDHIQSNELMPKRNRKKSLG